LCYSRFQNYEIPVLPLSYLPVVHLHGTWLPLDGYSQNVIFDYFSKISPEILILLNSKKKKKKKENVNGRCTSSHENKTIRSRTVVKQKGMVFGFRKTATAVTRPERQIDKFQPVKRYCTWQTVFVHLWQYIAGLLLLLLVLLLLSETFYT